jgi:DNA-binding transcriptional LysR family regulator
VLDVKRLKIFREVARLGSFSRAADALHYSQPAISHQISRLEFEVGAQLLERRPRGAILLTEVGSVLLGHAELLLGRMHDAEAELAEVIDARTSCVRLGAFATASATIVPHAIARVRRICPDATFTLIEGEASLTMEELRDHKIDIAVVFDDSLHPITEDEDVEVRYFFDDPMLLALPRRHRLARHEEVELGAFQDEDWIGGAGRETPCSLILRAACEEAGFEPRVSFNSGNYQAVQRLVAAGVGVALVPGLAINVAHPDVVIRSLRPQSPRRRIGVGVRRSGYRRPAVQVMLDELEQACDAYAMRELDSASAV